MNRLLERLRGLLQQEASLLRSLGAPPGGWLMQETVLRKGVACVAQPLPRSYRRGQPNHCFANAGQLVKRTKLLGYCEGYVFSETVPIPVHHAWAVDGDRRVIDTTLPNPEENAYLGILVDRSDLIALSIDAPSVLLDRRDMVRWEYMIQLCPALKDLIPPITRDEP